MPYKHWRIPIPVTNQLRIDTIVAMMYQMGWELHDAGAKGTSTLTITGKPTNGESVVLGSKTYQFRPAPSVEGEVLIGATAADCMANLSNAINHLGNPGTDYVCAAADTKVSATYDATHLYVTALRVGDICRGIASTKTYALASWNAATLTGGTPIVLKSNGEKGNRPYGYVAFDPEYSSDNFFFVKVCLYWDEVTHVGSCFAYYGGSAFYTFSPAEFFTVCGSKDLVVLHGLLAGTSSSGRRILGHFPAREDFMTRTTASIVAGRRVSVAVQSAIGLASGMAVSIVGLSEGRDKLLISSVTDDTHIVIENLPRDYSAGAYIGTPAMIFGHNSGSNNYDWFEVAHPDHVGLAEPASTPARVVGTFAHQELVHVDPDDFTGRYKLFPIHAGGDSSYPSTMALQADGNFGVIEGCNQGDILFINKDRSIPEAGTISSSTPTTLTDLTKNWVVNSLVGKNICIVNGPFSTVVRKIISNTATVITVDCDWKLTQLPVPSDYPAPGWSYRIADWTWRVLGEPISAQNLSHYGHFCYREMDFTFTL